MLNIVADPRLIYEAVELYSSDDPINIDAESWLGNTRNIALTDERGNVGMFDEAAPGVYTGHYFFKDRGKAAKALAVRMLLEMFDDRDAKVIRGLTPVDNRPAVWMTRHLGFKDYGTVETWIGDCIIFIMTKEEFDTLYKDA
jgi:hypothetical protein